MRRVRLLAVVAPPLLAFAALAFATGLSATTPDTKITISARSTWPRFELDQADAIGAYGVGISRTTSELVFPRLLQAGLPAGITWIVTDSGHLGFHVKGSREAVLQVHELLERLDAPHSNIRIRLRDVYVDKKALGQLMAADPDDPRNEFVRDPQKAGRILKAVRSGALTAHDGPTFVVPDEGAADIVRTRPLFHQEPRFWLPEPVPTRWRMHLKLKPRINAPGYIFLYVRGSDSALYTKSGPGVDPYWSEAETGGPWAQLINGKEGVLYTAVEEQPRDSTHGAQGIIHIVLATATYDAPSPASLPRFTYLESELGIGPRFAPESRLMVNVNYADAPALAWKRAGVDLDRLPDAPLDGVAWYKLYKDRMHLDWRSLSYFNELDPGAEVMSVQTETTPQGVPSRLTWLAIRAGRVDQTCISYDVLLSDLRRTARSAAFEREVRGVMKSGQAVLLAARRSGSGDNAIVRLIWVEFSIPNLPAPNGATPHVQFVRP